MDTASRIRLSRAEMEPLFGPLRHPRNWHRLEERISKFNRQGRPLGVSLAASRESAEVILSARSLEGLQRFGERLGAGPGHIQRSLAGVIASKLSGLGTAESAESLSERQSRQWSPWMSNPLQFLPGVRALMESVWVDPPFRLENVALKGVIAPAGTPGKKPEAPTAVDVVKAHAAGPRGQSLIIVGPSGIGKSSLLYRAFRQGAAAAGAPGSPEPVYLPANRLNLREAGAVDWESLPGVQRGRGERLDGLLREGRLALYLDGLDENPRLLDGGDPAVLAFWAAASRNKCFVTCRVRCYLREFYHTPIHGMFADRLGVIHLTQWSPAHAKALYSRISARDGSQGGSALEAAPGANGLPGGRRGRPGSALEAAGRLGRLSTEDLRARMGSLRLTGLSAWTYAVFFASRDGGRFPLNEYEMLDYLIDLMARWERGKLPAALPSDIAKGLLSKLAWSAYRRGNSGQALRVTPEDVLAAVRSDYPFYAEKTAELFAALRQMPVLSYDGATGSFELDRVFGCFLAAKHLVGLGLGEDVEGLREALQTPLNYEITDQLFQGLDCLDEASRVRLSETGRLVFESARRLYEEERSPKHATSMQAVLQPLGRLQLEPVRSFLREVIAAPGKFPEPVILSTARALAYMGDDEAVADYLRRLRRDARAREVNRNFYLFWLRDGRPAGGASWLSGLRVAGWERTCRWFLGELTAREYLALRPIHLFTFCDLAETHGPAKADGAELLRVATQLEREARGGSEALRREMARFRRLLGSFRKAEGRESRAWRPPSEAHEP